MVVDNYVFWMNKTFMINKQSSISNDASFFFKLALSGSSIDFISVVV